ncbi:unnamed protein product [Ectocarpus sp. 13 AM-2016]
MKAHLPAQGRFMPGDCCLIVIHFRPLGKRKRPVPRSPLGRGWKVTSVRPVSRNIHISLMVCCSSMFWFPLTRIGDFALERIGKGSPSVVCSSPRLCMPALVPWTVLFSGHSGRTNVDSSPDVIQYLATKTREHSISCGMEKTNGHLREAGFRKNNMRIQQNPTYGIRPSCNFIPPAVYMSKNT